MKLRKIYDFKELPTIEDIEKVEKDRGIKIPNNYKKILLDSDGGFPEKRSYYFKDGEGTNVIGRDRLTFDYVRIDGFNDLAEISYTDPSEFPKDMIPIATDGGGNYICISSSNGKIYYLDHEEIAEQSGDEPDYYGFYYICESLETFMDSLVED